MLPLAAILLALHLPSPPFLGLACGSAAGRCDRVGVAVWLRRPARHVVAVVHGRRVRLKTGRGGSGAYARGRFWQGFFRDAYVSTLADAGERVPVRVRATFAGGVTRAATATVTVSQGYG